MDRVNQIFRHPLYQKNFLELQEEEKDRIFCNHTLEHFLDVARLMYIYNLEDGSRIPRDLIYGAALLHDLGRNQQYQSGIPHDQASADLARVILPECGFSPREIACICHAILEHRGHTPSADEVSEDRIADLLASYLYRADKKSRNCFACQAQDECKWSMEKKNMTIQY